MKQFFNKLKQSWKKIIQFTKVLFSDSKNKPISLDDFFWRVIYAFSCLVVIISFVDFSLVVVAVIPFAFFVFYMLKWLFKNHRRIVAVPIGLLFIISPFLVAWAISSLNDLKLTTEYPIPIVTPTTSPIDSPTPSPSWTIYPSLLVNDHEMEDAYRPARFRSDEAKAIKKAIPSGAFLRDFAKLQGENAFLALYVLNPKLSSKESVMDYSERVGGYPMWCGASDFGQAMHGTYKLALFKNGKIINEVGIPFPDFDNWPDHKLETPTPEGVIGYMDMTDPEGVYKNEGGLMFRHARCMLDGSYYGPENKICTGSGMDFLETRQLQLWDLTGDGLPHEVKFMTEYISCGNDYYVIAGYDKETDQVMIYNIIDEDSSHPTYDDFEPRADGTVIHNRGCDHGSERHTIRLFRFNQKQKGFVQYYSTGSQSCDWYPSWYTPWWYKEII